MTGLPFRWVPAGAHRKDGLILSLTVRGSAKAVGWVEYHPPGRVIDGDKVVSRRDPLFRGYAPDGKVYGGVDLAAALRTVESAARYDEGR